MEAELAAAAYPANVVVEHGGLSGHERRPGRWSCPAEWAFKTVSEEADVRSDTIYLDNLAIFLYNTAASRWKGVSHEPSYLANHWQACVAYAAYIAV